MCLSDNFTARLTRGSVHYNDRQLHAWPVMQAADIRSITALFFVLVLCAATQDIAVDGWALTLLSRRHIGYAATCQVRLTLAPRCEVFVLTPLDYVLARSNRTLKQQSRVTLPFTGRHHLGCMSPS